MTSGSFIILWEYRVRHDRVHEFLPKYGKDGAWTALFRRSAGYLGTDLLRDEWDRLRFVTEDRWVSAAAYEDFQWHHQAAYASLDRECAPLFESQHRLGVFTRVTD